MRIAGDVRHRGHDGLDPGGEQAAGRGRAIGRGVSWSATWALRLLLIAAGVALVVFLIGELWVVFLPIALALILTTLLRPPANWLRRHRFPASLAAITVVIGALAVLAGIATALAPRVSGQLGQLAQQTAAGLTRLEGLLAQPPLNLRIGASGSITQTLVSQVQQRAATVATTVVSAVGTVTSVVVTALLTLVLTFMFVKDGSRFLPWVRRWAGAQAGTHLEAVLSRSWRVLRSFVRTQALVGLIDATLIGSALLALRVPLALPLMVVVFFAEAFLPVVGAIGAGAVSVLVALVSHGVTTAVIVLVVVVVVPQIEGNVLLPYLQGRSLRLHPGLVLVAVTAGGEVFGISGALLAVPVVAVTGEVFRYLSEQADRRAAPAAPAAPVPPVPTAITDGRPAPRRRAVRGSAGRRRPA